MAKNTMFGQNSCEYGYELACKLGCEQLASLGDIEQQCCKSGARYLEIDSKQVIVIEYLNQSYLVSLPAVMISLMNSEDPVSIKDKILILHYLTSAKDLPLSNKLITYKELPDGINYFPVFYKRAIKPLLDHFGREPRQLIDVAEKLGGHKAGYGDVAVTIYAFSLVPITLVLWQGNKEFPPEGNIMFDTTISGYMSIEDINVLCETITWRLVKQLEAGGDNLGRGLYQGNLNETLSL
ncbi:DUF3786 domain-containing protein [Chloroflexota bacterium]